MNQPTDYESFQCQIDEDQLDRIESKIDLLLAKKKPVKKRTSKKHVYSKKFELIWKDYPNTYGSSKINAYAAYNQRLSETDNPRQLEYDIHMAVIKYAQYIEVTGRYPKLPETFFGPSRHFVNNWDIPKEAESVPKDNEKLESWATERGFRGPQRGESYTAYRKAIEQLHRATQ